MVITIEEPKQEGWNSSLQVRGLVQGDYVVISVDGYKTDGQNEPVKYGQYNSILAYVDVYSYNYFDADKRVAVDKKLSQPVRCSYFMSEAIYNKIQNLGIALGQALKIQMSQTDKGAKLWKIEEQKDLKSPSPSPTPSLDTTQTELTTKGETVEQITPDFDGGDNLEELKTQIAKFKAANFSDNDIKMFLKDKFSVEAITEALKVA